MSFERKVWTAQLPEMRLAFFETTVPAAELPEDDLAPQFGELWDQFNEWRVEVRPSLGRIDIAAIGWQPDFPPGEAVRYRAGVPVRSDYQPPRPAQTTFFPGGQFVYCYADNVDEIPEAFQAVVRFLEEQQLTPTSGPVEVYKFHYNLEQHPCDCGFLVGPGEGERAHDGPLPVAR